MTASQAIQELERKYQDERVYTYSNFDASIRNNEVFNKLLDLTLFNDASTALARSGDGITNNFETAMRACLPNVETFEEAPLTLQQNAAFVMQVSTVQNVC